MNKPKVAVITGAARRLGAAIARNLHQQGFNILIHYHRSKEAAEKLASVLNQQRAHSALTVMANLEDQASYQKIRAVLENAWQRCDVLINNASTFYPKALADCDDSDWNQLFSSNLKAPFFLSQDLATLLKASQGCIINIADINGYKPRVEYALYCMAKAGNIMMTQALALELAPNVRVNGIAPGAILWPEDEAGNEIENESLIKGIPLGRLGGCESICEAVNFLIHSSSFITGEIIRVDGGQSVK